MSTPAQGETRSETSPALRAALAEVRGRLEIWWRRILSEEENAPEQTPTDERTGVMADEDGSPLATLCAAFGLSPFEREVLLLTAGAELDAGISEICRAAAGNAGRGAPTFGLALAAFPEPHWNALTPGAPLRRWRLLEVEPGETLTGSALRIEERVLHFLVGVACPEERLAGLAAPAEAPGELPSSHAELGEKIARHLASPRAGPAALVQLAGEDSAELCAVAAFAAEALGLRLHVLGAGDLPVAPAERESLARLLEREAVLARTLWLVDAHDAENPAADRAAALLQTLGCPALSISRGPLRGIRRPGLLLDLPPSREQERVALWRAALGPLAAPLNGELEIAARQFPLGAPEIRIAASHLQTAFAGQPTPDSTALGEALWARCRTQSRARLETLAQRIESKAGWEDLILPSVSRNALREIAAHVRHRHRVYETWGFGATSTRGLGITALFAGASGTGKTLAAEVLAAELGLDLFRIDLSGLVSKYIGETEKNLRRVFDAAEAGGAILLFDEADALFGKRSHVKDSHDRYANIEVGYLLQRMEAYGGLAILTTNAADALDPSFLRRLRFVVQFSLPDAGLRAEIWRRMFPAAAPTEGIDLEKLARLHLAGGHIRNIALHAAFIAAEAGEPLRMAHLLRATRGECAKLGRAASESEIGGWT